MPSYEYEIRTPSGQVSSGTIEASSIMDASEVLQSRGGYLLNLAPLHGSAAEVFNRIRNFKVESKPGLKDVRNFTNQLAVMIKAGINIRSAIEGVAEQIENSKFRKIAEQIKNDVESGEAFSEALAKHPDTFSPLYINMVRASELSGHFGEMLERIATYLTQQLETRSMIIGAMVYPAILAIMAVVTTTFMLIFVLPKFTVLFEGKEHLLPKPTLLLMSISNYLRDYWYTVVGGLAVMIGGLSYFKHTPTGGVYWDKCKLRMPVLKRMFRALYITRGLHTMGELVNAGVPMLETLKITSEISGNTLYKDMWESVHTSVSQGTRISQPLGEFDLLPKNVVNMIAAGEQSGRLGAVLRDVSEFYGKELRSTIKAVTSMIEPLMIVVMGAVVGFIAMSIILPVFKMSNLVKQ